MMSSAFLSKSDIWWGSKASAREGKSLRGVAAWAGARAGAWEGAGEGSWWWWGAMGLRADGGIAEVSWKL